jgi:hypothetical protein
MLVKLELKELKERRTSQKLIFLYRVVEGLVPAIEPDDYRYITAKTIIQRSREHRRFIERLWSRFEALNTS